MSQTEGSEQIEVQIPSNPCPSVAGRVPLLGSLRRSMGLPVIRDNILTEGFMVGMSEGFEQEFDVPEIVAIQMDEPGEEALEIARQEAKNFDRVVITSRGQVRGEMSGKGSILLREASGEEFTIDRDLSTSTEEQGESEASTSSPARIPSMAEAGRSKRELKGL